MKNIFLVIICLLAITGCWNDYPTYYISEEAKQWMDYKPGSWWVYQNDSTGILDCVWVDDYSKHLYRIEAGEKTKYKMEQIFYILKKKLNNKTSTVVINSDGIGTIIWFGEKYITDSLTYNNEWGLIRFNPNILDSLNTYQSISKITKKFDSLYLNLCWYKDVCQINVEVLNFGNIIYYISKHHGIIKYSTNNKFLNEAWTLNKYHIIQ